VPPQNTHGYITDSTLSLLEESILLSYRHAFHAGNFADVLKHSVLYFVLEYMQQKDKGLTYIDTHAGAGMYRLNEDYAQKTGEYKQGIEPLMGLNELPKILIPYIQWIKEINTSQSLNLYPGSSAIAKHLLRYQDSAHLFELHPSDNQLLRKFTQSAKNTFIHQADGYKGLLSLLPPPSRRGVVLIDPPYEIKSDYKIAVKTMIESYQKFSTGTYILWYPVVDRKHVERMIKDFANSNVKNLLQIEFCRQTDSYSFGMTGTGLFIINPPWQLNEYAQKLLPFLSQKLGDSESFHTLTQLKEE